MPRRAGLLALAIAAAALDLAGQPFSPADPRERYGRGEYERGYGGRGYGRSFRLPVRDIFPGNVFTFCRLQYESAPYGSGGGWATDYDASDINFSRRLSELTTIDVNRDEAGEIQHAVIQLMDDDLFHYPFLYMIEPGRLVFRDEELERLRSYLLRGGFLMVDDFWGEQEWRNFEYEIGRALPPDQFPIVDLPLEHEIFHCVFEIAEYPQVPSAHAWERGYTYERYDAGEPHFRAIHDPRGRMMVVICHNTDLGDGWEREDWSQGYFREMSVKHAYPMCINIVVYAMTH